MKTRLSILALLYLLVLAACIVPPAVLEKASWGSTPQHFHSRGHACDDPDCDQRETPAPRSAPAAVATAQVPVETANGELLQLRETLQQTQDNQELRARLEQVEQQRSTLRAENEALLGRLITAQIGRLEAEKELLEARLAACAQADPGTALEPPLEPPHFLSDPRGN